MIKDEIFYPILGLTLLIACAFLGFLTGKDVGADFERYRIYNCIMFSGEMWITRIEDTIGFDFGEGRTNTMTYYKFDDLVSICTDKESAND